VDAGFLHHVVGAEVQVQSGAIDALEHLQLFDFQVSFLDDEALLPQP